MANDQLNEQIVEILEQGEEEKAMVDAAKAVFIERGNPEPAGEKVTLAKIIKIYGPESIFQLISLLGSAYVSSLRVGILMEITQFNLIAKYLASDIGVSFTGSVAAMRWAAMAGFEGALLASGFYVGARLMERKHSDWVNWVALAVTIFGGALSSLTLLPNGDRLTQAVAWVFAVVSSVGAPLVVLYMAENMGFLWKEIINLQKKMDEEWKKNHDDWSKAFNADYPYTAAQLFGVERRRKLQKFEEKALPVPGESNGNGSVTESVRQYLKMAGILPSQVGDGPQYRMKAIDVANELNLEGKDRNNIRQYISRLKIEERQGKWN
jgi:hypothetical protein